MQYQDIYNCTKQAFEKNEVRELLEGRGNYNYQAPMYPVSLPTCIEFVMRDGIYRLYRETKNSDVIEKYSNALKEMIESEDSVMVWWATSILFSQKNREMEGKAPFRIADRFWSALGSRLLLVKDFLYGDYRYLGENSNDGLWGDVFRMHNLLKADYGVCLLGEK